LCRVRRSWRITVGQRRRDDLGGRGGRGGPGEGRDRLRDRGEGRFEERRDRQQEHRERVDDRMDRLEERLERLEARFERFAERG
jgi:molybdenum-dependent DNA-binding transcriptional regulator ModE